MPSGSDRTDYFDNIVDLDSRRAATEGYLAKELILRAAVPSRAADILRWYGWVSLIAGYRTLDAFLSFASRIALNRKAGLVRVLPGKYLVLHEDIFSVPTGWKVKRRLARGHFVLQRDGTEIGLIACRRGSIESAILADCLGRAGVRDIVYVGTCLRIGSGRFDVLVPRSLDGQNAFLQETYGEITISVDLSSKMVRALERNNVSTLSGPVYEAHGFLREEGPRQLRALQERLCLAIEMESAGLASALSQYGGRFCAALVPLDSFDFNVGLAEPLNSDVNIYLRLVRPIRKVIEGAALTLQL